MAKLDEIREKIDAVDAELVQLLNKRAKLVLEVKAAKAEANIDVYSPVREKQIIDRVRELAGDGPFPIGSIERIFGNIVSATRSLIGDTVVAFLAPEKSLCYDAALKQFGESVTYQSQSSASEVIKQIERGDAHYGVLPLQTGSSGYESSTIEALSRSSLFIIAELDIDDKSIDAVRFVVIGKKIPTQTGSDQTTLLAYVDERAGALRDLLQPFADKGVSLVKIESKSSALPEADFYFIIEVAGHQADKNVQEAIVELQKVCASCKVLGSYPNASKL